METDRIHTYPDEFHGLTALGSHVFPRSSGIVVLELQHIGYMRRILNIEDPPKSAILDGRKVKGKHRIHQPEPQGPKKDPQNSPSKDLGRGMVTQIHPRIHSEKCKRTRPKAHNPLVRRVPEPNPFTSQQRKINSKEAHVLGVAGGPAMRVTHLEKRTGLGASLLDRCLDELVDELRDYEAQSEEHALELAPEEEVRDEAAEADEDRHQRDPRQEVPQRIPPLVPHVGQRHSLRRHGVQRCERDN